MIEKNPTILIVDDEEIGQEALEGVLFGEGYDLLFADNGADAYASTVTSMPDLILLDVMMPGMNGFEVCKKIRANPLISEIPLLLVTALDDRESRLSGIDAGADDFITKPFDRLEIRTRVRTILRLNRYRRLIMERVRFAWVVEQASEGYIVLDPDGYITYSNPAAQAFLNIPDPDMTIAFSEHVRQHYNLEPEANWALWPDVGDRVLFLVRPETSYSPPVFLRLKMLELPLGNENKRMVQISDATAELSRQQDLWSFHHAITHKLNTPVSQIIMSAQLAQRMAEGAGQETMTELAQAIVSGATDLREQIQQILGYLYVSNTAGSGMSFSVADLPALLKRTCEESDIRRCTIHLGEGVETLAVCLSFHAFEVICRELIGNAKKFHPGLSPNLEISLQPAQVESASGSHTQAVMFTVADDGISLTPEQFDRVWQPYYQGEKVFSGQVAGMGLGLSGVANLVWGAGGKCRIYNRERGPGVAVELLLPVCSA